MEKGYFGGAEEQLVTHLWGHGQPMVMDSGETRFPEQPSLA